MIKQQIDFRFPIDYMWTEEQLFNMFYTKISKYPEIYLEDSILRLFKQIKKKTLANLIIRMEKYFKDSGMTEKLPIIFLIAQLTQSTYALAKEKNMSPSEILILRVFSIKNPPETSADFAWHTSVQPKIMLQSFLK